MDYTCLLEMIGFIRRHPGCPWHIVPEQDTSLLAEDPYSAGAGNCRAFSRVARGKPVEYHTVSRILRYPVKKPEIRECIICLNT